VNKLSGTLVGESSFELINNILPTVHSMRESLHCNRFRVCGIARIDNLLTIEKIYGANTAAKFGKYTEKTLKANLKSECNIIQIGLGEHLFIASFTSHEEFLKKINTAFEVLRADCLYQDGVYIYPIIAFGYAECKDNISSAEIIDNALLSMHCDHKFRASVTEKVRAAELSKHDSMRKAGYFYKACIEGRVRLAFQPVVRTSDFKATHYECLLRIITEEGEIISAGPFIEAAEDFGFAVFIDKLVFRMAVEELKRNPDIYLAVNCSSLSMYGNEWLSLAQSLISDSKIASRLMVEITETSSRRDLAVMTKFVEHLKRFGCLVALDDFGAGYTSFAQLKVLNVDIIKIDGLFIKDFLVSNESRAFVKLLLEFAKRCKMKTIAEFVETKEVADILTEYGVDYLQGHYFGSAKLEKPWE
jgi:EAL domain-containing protein (putative c-di-GMP-specific phosphodiesterase class I)